MRMFLAFSALLITRSLFAATAVDVPMLFSGTRPAVHVRVNGKGPFLFLLEYFGVKTKALIDTGNIRAIDMPPASVAGLRQTSYARLIGRGHSASGEFEIREISVADSLAIAGHTIPLGTVTFTDEINIGSAFLRRFIVTIDQPHSRFRLSR